MAEYRKIFLEASSKSQLTYVTKEVRRILAEIDREFWLLKFQRDSAINVNQVQLDYLKKLQMHHQKLLSFTNELIKNFCIYNYQQVLGEIVNLRSVFSALLNDDLSTTARSKIVCFRNAFSAIATLVWKIKI